MADKLDILMEILFKYIHEVTHINGEHSVDAGTELFNELLLVSDDHEVCCHGYIIVLS